ncbi:PREDICTED: F-box/kelch-repeat protein At3g23880-like [Lupinus angustifolius]|uniref:F-box/kelch-repeat protein At3g23880-like n=1 Tax=Lupinus angustifolius TaxID=3871 RepID=UPI00092EEC30|nr:PREDICTED: F-box/kelch-repeat protein At3g23880-like [Lupinus angustifolius]
MNSSSKSSHGFRLSPFFNSGSCNGLVCFRKRHFVDDEVIGFQVRFWNPALRLRSKKSPSLHLNWSDYEYGPARYGFGYDNSSDTYKVAVISLGSENTVVEVLSMGDNRWRKILSFPAFPFLCQLYGKFLSGTLNWLALNKSGYRYDWGTVTVNQLVIFSLDLEKETYKQMSLPTGLDEVPSVEPKLGYLWDCLCLFLYYRGSHFVIWQMKEFGVENSWTQLISISYQHLQIVNDEYHALLPLFTTENGDALVLVNNADFEAIIYYWKDKRVERIEIPNLQLWIDAKEHIPSMVLPC